MRSRVFARDDGKGQERAVKKGSGNNGLRVRERLRLIGLGAWAMADMAGKRPLRALGPMMSALNFRFLFFKKKEEKSLFLYLCPIKQCMMLLKPLFDRTVALIGLLLLWPVLLVIALLVRVKIGKPVFFVQERIGKDGKPFKIHKFHTMTDGLDDSPISIAGEERITPFGAKLRHYKLDELPELWDVLIGNMSFVGPRPDVPGYADQLQGDDRDVLKLRPGITGPATLKYRLEDEMIAEYVAQKQKEGDTREAQDIAVEYNDTVIYPDKVRLNCYYYRNYSFVKDIQMLFCTVLGKKMEYAGERI